MGQIKKLLDDYLSSEEFDIMFDHEYEIWLEQKKAEQAAYEEFLEINPNFALNN
jgi:hypothetical protein